MLSHQVLVYFHSNTKSTLVYSSLLLKQLLVSGDQNQIFHLILAFIAFGSLWQRSLYNFV